MIAITAPSSSMSASEKCAPQSCIQLRRHAALGIGQRDFVRIGDHGLLGVGERAGLEVVHRVDLRLRDACLQRARHVLLVAGAAAVQQRQLQARQLLVALVHVAAEEDARVEMVHHEVEHRRVRGERLDEGRLAGQLVERVPGDVKLLRQLARAAYVPVASWPCRSPLVPVPGGSLRRAWNPVLRSIGILRSQPLDF